jgi:hypothetical protein
MMQVLWHSAHPNLHHIALFADRDIEAGEFPV